MTGWTVSTSPPQAWHRICEQGNYVFQSEAWMTLLEGAFGCSSVFATSDNGTRGTGISLFPAGPFQVGYLGFPVGGMIGDAGYPEDLAAQLKNVFATERPACIRIPVSGFSVPASLDLPYATTMETAIVDLQSWSLDAISKNRRRDVRKSQRSGLQVVDAMHSDDGKILYAQYSRTMERKGGSLRYTEDYFKALIGFAQDHPHMRVLLAKLGDAIAGFTVVVLHGSTAYYLHGAFDWAMREHIPSAILLNEAIEWAKSRGSEVFNLMSSPPGQDTLVRYKEHWGAETREHRTFTAPISANYNLFRIAEKLYRLVR